METLVDWLLANQLCINESKTELIVYRPHLTKLPDDFFIEINFCKIFPSKYVKYIGVYIDEHLNFDVHFSHLTRKLSHCVGIISKLRHYTSVEVCLSVYFALFYSHLIYGCLSWQFVNNSLINKLSVLQRKIIRLISFSMSCDSTSPIFYLLGLLKVVDIFENRILIFFFQLCKKEVPIALNEILVNSVLGNNLKRLRLPRVNSTRFGIKSLKLSGVSIWNTFFDSVKDKSSLKSVSLLKKLHVKKCIDSYKE